MKGNKMPNITEKAQIEKKCKGCSEVGLEIGTTSLKGDLDCHSRKSNIQGCEEGFWQKD